MRITAVVLNWRRPDDTIACVASLRTHAPDVEVVVVDNASGDGSVERIRAADGEVEILQNPTNAGYAGGNDVGIARALEGGADAVLILNSDVTLTDGCVATLAQGIERGYGIVAPLSLKADDPTICDFYVARVDLRNMALLARGRDEAWPGLTEPAETDYATGSALLVDADLLRKIGSFDERFFLVWEDVDLCLRARAAGTRIVVAPTAVVHHGRSTSFGGDGAPLFKYFFVRNSFLVLERHGRWPWKKRTRAMIERRYRGWVDQPGTDEATARAIALGLEHGLAGRWGPAPDELQTR